MNEHDWMSELYIIIIIIMYECARHILINEWTVCVYVYMYGHVWMNDEWTVCNYMSMVYESII